MKRSWAAKCYSPLDILKRAFWLFQEAKRGGSRVRWEATAEVHVKNESDVIEGDGHEERQGHAGRTCNFYLEAAITGGTRPWRTLSLGRTR